MTEKNVLNASEWEEAGNRDTWDSVFECECGSEVFRIGGVGMYDNVAECKECGKCWTIRSA